MAISSGIDLRYPLGCLELSPLDLGIEGSVDFLLGDPRQAGTGPGYRVIGKAQSKLEEIPPN